MDDLIEGVSISPVDFADVTATPLEPIAIPEASVRNKAATLAYLSDPSKVVDNYNAMMAEAGAGEDAITNGLANTVQQQVNAQDEKGFMSLLSDPTVPIEQKLEIARKARDSVILKDNGITLLTKGAEKDSPGETPEAENARVDTVARDIEAIYKARSATQGVINAYMSKLDPSTGRAVFEMADETISPLGTNILMRAITSGKQDATIWDAVKAFVDPGKAKAGIRDNLQAIPLEQREQATREMLEVISKNSHTLLTNDNDYAKFKLAQELLQSGDYSNVDRWIDTVAGVLDVVGLGWTARGGAKAIKGFKEAKKVVEVPPNVTMAAEAERTAYKAPQTVQEGDLSTVTQKPTVGIFDERISALESQKASLLGEASNTLDKGQVASLTKERKDIIASVPDRNELANAIQKQQGITSKAAKVQADALIAEKKADTEASLRRIDGMLEENRKASTLAQRISDIEKEIALLQKRNTPVFLEKNYLYKDIVERVELNAVARIPQPASPIELLKLSNPHEARNLHAAILTAPSDDVAMAVANSNKVQAIANNILPQISRDGKVNAGVVDIDRSLRTILDNNPKLKDALKISVDNLYSDKELAAARANVVNKFSDVSGLHIRENMASFDHDGVRTKISAVYGTSEGDFNLAQHAYDQAKVALRWSGIDESSIEILAKRGTTYEPVKLDEVKDVPGSYVVRINTEHTIDPSEITFFEKDRVKWNFIDRMNLTWDKNKSVNSILMDYASMLDPRYTGSAVVGVDKSARFEKLMLEIADDYAVSYNKLPKSERVALDSYFIEANFKGLPLDPSYLLHTKGLSQDAVDAAVKWRKFWDAHYYLENYDVIRTMRAQGWQKFDHQNAQLFGRPIAKDSTIGMVYDADLDAVVSLSKADLDNLYQSGGTVAKMRRPSPIQGQTVEHFIVRNNANSYLRTLNENDSVLNYREGYFQIQYKAGRFIDEFQVVNGKEVRRAVAVAADTVEAKRIEDRLNATAAPFTAYRQRADDRNIVRGSDDWFDVESASGRISQRHRGKMLEGADISNGLNRPELIVDPVTAATRSARSISGRTVMRSVIDTAKERWMANYGHLVGDPNSWKEKKFPTSHADFGEKGLQYTSEMADARTTWNYINYLENGYINGADNLQKSVMNAMAEFAGELGAGRVERGLRAAGELSVTQAAKGGVFNAMIASNPLRQLVVQTHQGVRTFAYNVRGWITGDVPGLVHDYGMYVMTGKTKNNDFVKFVEESGMLDAVDKNSLVRGSLREAADNSVFGKVVKTAGAPFEWMRKVGFDAGERTNNIVHLAATFDKFKRQGKNLNDAAVMDEARSVARAVSYDMNAAGDMLYNQTAAGVLLQFMQVPHKAVLNYTNRRISGVDRLKMATFDTIFWGGPAYLISEWFNTELPDDPAWRDFITQGLEGATLNWVFQNVSGNDDLRMDWSSLAPADMTGTAKAVTIMLTDGPLKALANSPANQLFGEEGRVRNALLTAGRFFAGSVNNEYETPATLTQVLTDFAKISSGVSNASKAYAMMELEKKLNAQGVLIKDNPSLAEAMVQIVGFQDMTTKARFEFVERQSKSNKQMEEDIKKDIKAIAKYYQDQYNAGIRDPEQLTALSGYILRRYNGNQKASEIANKYILQALNDPDARILSIIMETSKFPDPKVYRERMKDIPMEQYKKDAFITMMDDIQKYGK